VTLVRSTADVHPSRRFALWRDVISETYMSVDMSRPKWDAPFDGRLELVSLGAIELSRMTVSGSRVAHRRAMHIAQGSSDRFFVTLPLNCRVSYAHCERDVELDGESLCLVDAGRPASVFFPDEHRLLNVSIPGAMFRSRLGSPEDYCGLRIPADRGAAHVAKSLVVSLFEQADQIGPELLAEFGERVVDVIALALTAHPGALRQVSHSVRWAHLLRARKFIDRHLTDPELGPGRIAAELGISARYLARIFELAGQSVGGWILERRLDRAYRALASRAFSHRSISAIAFAAGFNDAAHFSRAFRKRYGVSPRDHRVHTDKP
jgi:AraC-like DNA-binding protein